MKNTALTSLVLVIALLDWAHSFTVLRRPPLSGPIVVTSRRHPHLREGALETNEVSVTNACENEEEEELSETKKLLKKVKEAGVAGAISYAAWEFGFWGVSIPVCVLGYKSVTGHWPDFSDVEDQKKLGAEAFAFVNFARFAVPLRIGLALSTTPWIDENVVKKFLKRPEESEENCEVN